MAEFPGADLTDEDLLAAAQRGDRGALEALISRYQSTVYRFGVRMCGDLDDASDVVQETSLAMARSIQDFRGDSSLSTWLYTIARRFCIRKRRRGRFAPEREESLETLDHERLNRLRASTRSPEDEVAGRELGAALNDAIASLDPSQREVLVLRDMEGLPASEVGKVLGLNVGAVKSRLHRARLAVRAELAPLLGPAITGPVDQCPDVLNLLSRHLEGDLAPDACSEMEAHLKKCPRCTGACESLKRALALCREAPAPELPESVRQSIRTALGNFLARRVADSA
jgi:RNA polymerase sigma-70 factor (ECF subfamily)